MAELEARGALKDFKAILCLLLLQAASAEVQELAARDDIPVEYLASALHKCGVFSQAVGVREQAEVCRAETSCAEKHVFFALSLILWARTSSSLSAPAHGVCPPHGGGPRGR